MSISRAERFPGPANLPPDDEQTARHVQLKPEEIERSVERLAKARVWKPDRTPILPPIVKNEEEIGKTVERLYYAKMKQAQEKQQRQSQMAQTHQQQGGGGGGLGKKLSADTQEEMANRLSNNGKTRQVEKLREKYYNQTYAAPQGKVLPATQLQESLSRMYNDSMQRKRETERRLREKYVENTLPAPKRLPADAIQAASERLFATVGK